MGKVEHKTVVSLFSGCGGMDIGFEGGFSVHPSLAQSVLNKCIKCVPKTIFSTIFANDIRLGAKNAWENYHKTQNVFHLESIVELVKRSDSGKFNFPKCDVLTGGFPCQDFSVAGKRQGFDSSKSDLGVTDYDTPTAESRGMLYMWMRRVIELTQPKVFVAENVKGLVSLGDALNIIAKDFSTVGGGYYVFPPKVLKASNYGIPQSRERVFFIGVKKSCISKAMLKAISSDPENREWNPYPEVIINTPKLRAVLKGLAEPEMSDDKSQQTYSKAKWYGKHCQGQIEVNLDGEAPTIRSEHHGNIEFRRLHPDNGGRYLKEFKEGHSQRRLTIRECARIQTFPDDYEFVFQGENRSVSGSEAYKLIGNAVPPLLAYQIARRLEKVWTTIFKHGN